MFQINTKLIYFRNFLIVTFLTFIIASAFTNICQAQTAQQEQALKEYAKKIDERRVEDELRKLDGRRKISEKEWESADNFLLTLFGVFILGWIAFKVIQSQYEKKEGDKIARDLQEEFGNVERITNTEARSISKIGQIEVLKIGLKKMSEILQVPMMKVAKGLEILGWDCLDYPGSKAIGFRKQVKILSGSTTDNSTTSEKEAYEQLVKENRLEFLKKMEKEIPIEKRDVVMRLITSEDYTGAKIYFGFFDEKLQSISGCEGWYNDFAEEAFSTIKSEEIFYDSVNYFDPAYHFTVTNTSGNATMLYLNRCLLPTNCKFITFNFYPKNDFDEHINTFEVVLWPSGLSGFSTHHNWNFDVSVDKFFQVGIFNIDGNEIKFSDTPVIVQNANPKKLGKSVKVISKKFPWIN